jgi:PAS domain S-box-containing protein
LLVTERRTPEGGIVGVRTDITAIKKAEEASCRSKEFLDHVLDAMDHDVFVKDERHRWVILNKAACELIGGSREELIGRSDDDFFSTEQAALNWKTDDEALESGNTINYEWKSKKDGQCRTFLSNKSVFSDSLTGKRYIAGVAIDITERKRAEEALFHEKERAQVTLHCIGDGVITTDPSCGVEYLNPVAEALTGWTTEEAQGNPLAVIFNILEEQSRTPVPNPVACCLKEGQIVGLANHTVLISRYGQEHAIEDSASPIRGRDGEVLGAMARQSG